MSVVNHPAHYNNHPSRIEAIDIIEPPAAPEEPAEAEPVAAE